MLISSTPLGYDNIVMGVIVIPPLFSLLLSLISCSQRLKMISETMSSSRGTTKTHNIVGFKLLSVSPLLALSFK